MSNILKQRLEAAQSVQTEHPSPDALVAFLEQGLKGTERERVMGHLSVCPPCRQAVALAGSEVIAENAGVAAASRPFPFRLSAATRWASLTAALAIAVGVGVISYEHQSAPRHTRMSDVLTAPRQAEMQVRPASEAEARAEIGKTKGKASAPKSERADVRARSPEAMDGRIKDEKVERVGNVLGARLGKEKKSATDVQASQTQLADSLLNGREQGDEKVSAIRDQNALKAGAPAPVMATAAAPASAQTAKELDVDSRSAQRNAESSSVQGGLVGGLAGGRLQSQPAAGKVMRSAAIGGPLTAKAYALDYGGFVRWTISATGQLQRDSQDGTLTVIEPAPGVTVRAVAAEGIEVWAAGVQPDLSAQEWQQRPALFHSSDAGETWTRINGPWQSSISSLNLTSKNNLIVLAQDGTWITSDAGKSWAKK